MKSYLPRILFGLVLGIGLAPAAFADKADCTKNMDSKDLLHCIYISGLPSSSQQPKGRFIKISGPAFTMLSCMDNTSTDSFFNAFPHDLQVGANDISISICTDVSGANARPLAMTISL